MVLVKSHWQTPSLLAAVMLIPLLGGGCGSSGKTTTVTVSKSGQRTQTPSVAAPPTQTTPTGPLVHAPPPLVTKGAEALVRDYYTDVDDARFPAAWSLLATDLQTKLGGYATWRSGYALTTATRLLHANATLTSPTAASVAIGLSATDRDACGDDVRQTFEGTWMVESVAGHLRGIAFSVQKTGGATPVRDASACGTTPTNCDPSYVGACLDPTSSDYDCLGGEGDGPDYTGPVTVVGDDHFDLDTGDGDPRACEPVQ